MPWAGTGVRWASRSSASPTPTASSSPATATCGRIAESVREGIWSEGGVACEFGTIGVCDGLAMGHAGMKYSLPSRDLIADSVEIVAQAHALDGLVLVVNCDKIVPGMLMAAARLDIPSVIISGGPMLAGSFDGKDVGLEAVFEAVGSTRRGQDDRRGPRAAGMHAPAPGPAPARAFSRPTR